MEFVAALAAHCLSAHTMPCNACNGLVMVGRTILEKGYIVLSDAFKLASPGVKYSAENARKKFLQMPLVAIRIGNPMKGHSFSVLMEMCAGLDYSKLGIILNSLILTEAATKRGTLEKSVVKMLLNIAHSDRERMCLRYAIVKSSGMTSTAARRIYGFENMFNHIAEVEEAITKVQHIREAIQELASVEDKALCQSFGLDIHDSSSDEMSSDDSVGDDVEVEESSQSVTEELQEMLCNDVHHYNWFHFFYNISSQKQQQLSALPTQSVLDSFKKCGFEEKQVDLLTQSYLAFFAVDSYDQERMARAVNGEVVSESESDDPEAYTALSEPLSAKGKELIARKRIAIRRRSKRRQEKAIAEQRFLSRKVSKRGSRIVSKFPDIGETIESFVQEHKVGADAWRRTGVLTFDGNTKVSDKVTYEKIRQHLEEVYHHKFSYGTVIQLCVPRNRKRSSAKRYLGIAKVTSRRARKGFNLRLNPDDHWSAALYRGLNELQYVDGKDILNVNRDDATGFRLDTMTTCMQYRTPVVQSQQVLTTRTDYVNKYPSVLQTTSYNFSKTNTTGEVCVGIVKAFPIHQKNPAQHIADLCMLESKTELKPVFVNLRTGCPKSVECIRVDGAADEGPSHTEVLFWWTQRHLFKKRLATLVSTRSSGSSYLNRVELQNGCLSLGHANTFIPSTLAGNAMDPATGTVNEAVLKESLSLAIAAYINRVNGCSCGETTMQLYRGADAGNSEHIQARAHLLTFLKGTRAAREKLRKENPVMYADFELVWDIRRRHMVQPLPTQYIFFLVCCFEQGCPHPLCKEGHPRVLPSWYEGGPPITYLPLPVPDPTRPWGNESCSTCPGFCAGHYSHQFIDTTDKAALAMCIPPPSTVLKNEFSKLTEYPPPQDCVDAIAKKVLLTPETTHQWWNHLHTVVLNRKRGAKKAAETRTKSRKQATTRSSDVYHCGTCMKEYSDQADNELWIGCDLCDKWFCGSCEGLLSPPQIDIYLCKRCRQ